MTREAARGEIRCRCWAFENSFKRDHVAERGGRSFVEAITGNTTLSYLNLTYNAIPASLQQEIREGWASGRESTLGLHL